MATTKYDPDGTAQHFNLTEAEAVWVGRAVERGAELNKAVIEIRGQRVGPAADPDWRPLSPAVAEELGLTEPEFVPISSDDIEVLDDIEVTP